MAATKQPGAPAKPASEKYQAVTVRLHPTTAKRLRRLARRLKMSQGEVVAKALEELVPNAAAPLQVSQEQWSLWLGTDHSLTSLNQILAGERPESTASPLTRERVQAALKRSAAGSNELAKQLRDSAARVDTELRLKGGK